MHTGSFHKHHDDGLHKEVCNGGVACSLLKMVADKPRPLLQNSLGLTWFGRARRAGGAAAAGTFLTMNKPCFCMR